MARVFNIPIPGALLAYIGIALTLYQNGLSFWWLLPSFTVLAVLVYIAYGLQASRLDWLGKSFQWMIGMSRDDEPSFFHAALNPLHMAPWWQAPAAYVTVILTPFALLVECVNLVVIRFRNCKRS